eukprot:COSAG05_NODE_400_length_10261_cov_477.765499_3_plen_94_part_00
MILGTSRICLRDTNRICGKSYLFDCRGSPHIDKQNIGPFYGLALGDFPAGQGGIRVECSARQVAEVGSTLSLPCQPRYHCSQDFEFQWVLCCR